MSPFSAAIACSSSLHLSRSAAGTILRIASDNRSISSESPLLLSLAESSSTLGTSFSICALKAVTSPFQRASCASHSSCRRRASALLRLASSSICSAVSFGTILSIASRSCSISASAALKLTKSWSQCVTVGRCPERVYGSSIPVGESRVFRWGSPKSLWPRDPLFRGSEMGDSALQALHEAAAALLHVLHVGYNRCIVDVIRQPHAIPQVNGFVQSRLRELILVDNRPVLCTSAKVRFSFTSALLRHEP